MDISHQLLSALNLWLELSEVDPGAKSFTIGGEGISSYTVVQMHRAIKEALELDDSNISGILLLDALSDDYFNSRNFTINQLLADPARTNDYIQRAAQLRRMISCPAFTEKNQEFVGKMRAALARYGMESEKTCALASNLQKLGFLRRDAFRSIKNLRVDQFLSGEPEPAGVAPMYHPWVHQFWNINELVEAACSMPSGVTLSLVRDPDDLQSYFVFAIRNGGNLFLFSDVPVHTHPLQKYRSRRPERAFSARTSQNWFPYDLLNLKFDEEAKVFFADEARRRAIIPHQQKIDRLTQIKNLAPDEVLWTIMMFDLIVEKFWHKGHQEKALSYTGAMIREARPLLDAAATANLPVVAYKQLELPPLQHADLTQDAVLPAVQSDGGRPNAWLEARYAAKVDPELFNLLDTGANKLYLPPMDAQVGHVKEHKNHDLAVVTASYVSVLPADDKELPFWHKEGRYALHALPTTSFGTQAELESNRIFLARHNQAQAIQRLADAEFNERKDAIKTWFTDRVHANLDYLFSLAANANVRRVFEPTEPGAKIHTVDGYHYPGNEFNFVYVCGPDDAVQPLSSCTVYLHNGYYKNKAQCIVTHAASTFKVFFQPQTAAHLAELAGCDVSELPDILQHWAISRDYQGNSNLDRIDPMAWALHDPWCGIDFRIQMHLSKSGMQQLKKRFLVKP